MDNNEVYSKNVFGRFFEEVSSADFASVRVHWLGFGGSQHTTFEAYYTS